MPYLVFKVVFSLAVRLDCISAICVRVNCFDLGIPSNCLVTIPVSLQLLLEYKKLYRTREGSKHIGKLCLENDNSVHMYHTHPTKHL